MKQYPFAITVTVLVLLGSAATAAPKVLIISVDGCRPDALQIANTPNIDAMMAAGAFSLDARNTMTHGASGPNYSSMLTGVDVPKHGVTSNNWNATVGFVGNHFDLWPNLFAYVEALDSSLYTASFVGWGPINVGLWADRFADEVGSFGNAGNTAKVVDLLTNADPDVIFLQLSQVDSAGHSSGFSPASGGYLAAIEDADADCGAVYNALFARPGYIDGSEDWLVLTVTDHGGKGTHHDLPGGGEEVYRTFYIVDGPSVVRGADLGTPRVFDVAVTAMAHMGVNTEGLGLDGRIVVPEPAGLSLLALGGLTVLKRRRKRAR